MQPTDVDNRSETEAKTDPERIRYVKIVWGDHAGLESSSWVDAEDLDFDKLCQGVVVVTAGPLLHETEDAYLVGNSVGSNGHISNAIAILKPLVREFYYLEEA